MRRDQKGTGVEDGAQARAFEKSSAVPLHCQLLIGQPRELELAAAYSQSVLDVTMAAHVGFKLAPVGVHSFVPWRYTNKIAAAQPLPWCKRSRRESTMRTPAQARVRRLGMVEGVAGVLQSGLCCATSGHRLAASNAA